MTDRSNHPQATPSTPTNRTREDADGRIWLYGGQDGNTCYGAVYPWGGRDGDETETFDADGILFNAYGYPTMAVDAVLYHHEAKINGGAPPTIAAPRDRPVHPEFETLCKLLGLDTEPPKPEVNRGLIELFIRTTFKHVTAGTYASVRAFYQNPIQGRRKSFKIVPVKLDGSLDVLIDRACRVAELAANATDKVVLSPPVATFTNNRQAREEDLAEGLVINVECDEHASAARVKLEALLGPATIVVESGGLWTDPDTGKAEPKLHLYWVLKVPTRTKDEHHKLKEARRYAAAIAGADGSNVSIVHPIRWPGSLHRKGEPRLCRIIELNADAEIGLDEALTSLRAAASNGHEASRPAPGNGSGADTSGMAGAFTGLKVEPFDWVKPYDSHPVPFPPVRQGCAWLRDVHETGGRDYGNGLWTQAVFLATFMENGNALAHEFSDKYERGKGYVYGETQHLYERKLDERKRNPKLGWTSCQAIKDLGSKYCESCPHFSKKLSPLHLGLQLRQAPGAPKHKLFQSSAEFVANFVPPDYLIDGFIQRRCVYSFTAKTGDGKTTIALLIAAYVARGTPLAGCEVEKGRVLIFVGENPDDVRTRWIMLCEELGVDPDQLDVVFMPFTVDLSAQAIRAQIDAEAAKAGPFSLLIVDTSASYYSGDDENDNVQLGRHANMLRSFINLPGGPTILVTCHPTKNPDMENLLPRGGGAFLAAVDGNLVAIKDANTMLVELTTHGKFRGPDFAPFTFKLIRAQSPNIVDSKGRRMWSVYAQAISPVEQEEA
jgi:hypothetical protein